MGSRLVAVVASVLAGIALAGCGGGQGGTTAAQTPPDNREPPPPDPSLVPPPSRPASPPPSPSPAPAPAPTRIGLIVEGGRPQGGIARPEAPLGENVVLVVRSDVADEVHVHGYDVSRSVARNGTARLAFAATIPGRFEVELEERGVQIAELTVEP